MDRLSHDSDIEARDPDKLRDQTLGAGTSLAPSFGAEVVAAGGSAESLCPGGLVAAQPPVRDQGPDASRERSRLDISAKDTDPAAGGRVTPPAKNHSGSTLDGAPAATLEICSLSYSETEPVAPRFALPPPKATGDVPGVVGRRVDALVLAYKLDVHPPARAEFEARIALASTSGNANLRFAGLTFHTQRTRRLNVVSFQSNDLRCVFDEQAPGRWTLEVVVRASFLATRALAEALTLADCLASDIGQVLATRLRRVDSCADFVRFPLLHDDVKRIVSHARPVVFIPDEKDIDEAEGDLSQPKIREYHARNLTVTGITVGPGNPFMARLYLKTAQLLLAGYEVKRAMEHDIWYASNWDGQSPVVRVEFQIRGTALDELDLRDPTKLPQRLDSIWQTGVRWMRLVIPDSATRPSRRKLDPRWIAVSTIPFDHLAPPIKRRRLRGGATPEHAIGAVLSRLAGSQQLERVELISDDGEVIDSEFAFANSMSDAQAKNYLLRYFRQIGARFSKDILDRYVQAHGPQGAVLRVIARHNAAVARFSSVDDLTAPNTNQSNGGPGDITTTKP